MGAEMGESVGVAMVVAEREKLPKRTRTRALDTPSRDPVSAAVAPDSYRMYHCHPPCSA